MRSIYLVLVLLFLSPLHSSASSDFADYVNSNLRWDTYNWSFKKAPKMKIYVDEDGLVTDTFADTHFYSSEREVCVDSLKALQPFEESFRDQVYSFQCEPITDLDKSYVRKMRRYRKSYKKSILKSLNKAYKELFSRKDLHKTQLIKFTVMKNGSLQSAGYYNKLTADKSFYDKCLKTVALISPVIKPELAMFERFLGDELSQVELVFACNSKKWTNKGNSVMDHLFFISPYNRDRN